MLRLTITRAARSASRVSPAARLGAAYAFTARAVTTKAASAQSSRNAPGLLAMGAITAAAGMTFAQQFVEAKEAQDYSKVREMIADLISDDIDMGPTLVRLSWHASGTWDAKSKTGGSNGATMRFETESKDPANAGLDVARNFLEPVKKQFPWISYSDLWTLAGVVAIEEMGGPAIGWRAGRKDKDGNDDCPPNGRLPSAGMDTKEATIQHVRDVFYRMGFNDREIVALIGAHALGRGHVDRSGYDGPWTRAPTSFTNDFFRELLENTWTVKKWKGPEQYEDPTGELMMLPADMALIWDPTFRKYVELYRKDEETWFKDFSAAFQKLNEFGL